MPTLPQRFISLSVLALVTLITLSGCAPKANKVVQPLSPSSAAVEGDKGTTAPKTDSSQCMDNFTLLQKLNPSAYSKYNAQFDKIRNSYSYYQKHRDLLEKDPAELMSLTLKDKLNLICERVKSQTFIELSQRMKVISTI
ncbi:hypothetical protein [Candidatus Regiella endosymbiont of Tuberolachnus salignus]|uniref:hypothetical protein n=1 Tax=Candidatus Regiella endosymbiont of Tuberolachnus salignus TaxID=3077956 RepID=UPI0030D1F1D0